MKAPMADIPEPCKYLLNACKAVPICITKNGHQSILVASNRSTMTYSEQRDDFFESYNRFSRVNVSFIVLQHEDVVKHQY